MSALSGARCVGLWWLFDSTSAADHREAKLICETCPAMRACADQLERARRASHLPHGPAGTWAGRLVGVSKADERARLEREESIYDDDEAYAAHLAYNHGSRGAWAVTGHRVWDRRTRRARTRQRRESAA